MKEITLDIALPIRNEARWLGETLECIAKELKPGIQILLGDNASDDGSEDICRQFLRRYPEHIKYFRHDDNIGSVKNFNFLKGTSEAQYLMFMGAHDLVSSGYFAAMVSALESNPNAILAFPTARFIEREGSIYNFDWEPDSESVLFNDHVRRVHWVLCERRTPMPIHGVFRRSAIDHTKIKPITSSDILFLSEAAIRGTFVYCSDATFYHRMVHGIEETAKMFQRQAEYAKIPRATKPYWQLYVAHLRAILLAPRLSPVLRMRLLNGIRRSYTTKYVGFLAAESPALWLLHRIALFPIRVFDSRGIEPSN